MKIPDMTHELARAAATDAGNRSMRAHNRERWNEEDTKAANREYIRLMPTSVSTQAPRGNTR